ncbi:MAG TPA: hypothetical protein VFO70_06325 [Chitinophagaceae bacterium]|nr:hypothetical protein [Chitinophagaceae bacterium]
MNLPANTQTNNEPGKLHAVIKFYPLALLDFNFPTVQPAIEARNNRFGVQFTWGFNNNFYTMQDGAQNKYYVNGNRYRLEFRRYRVKNVKSTSEKFRGVVLFATNYSKAMRQFQFRDRESKKNYSFEKGTIHKKVYGIAYKTGGIMKLGKRISLEYSPEIGIRIVKTSFTDFIDLKEIEWRPRNSVNPESSLQGTKILPHPGITVGISYRVF